MAPQTTTRFAPSPTGYLHLGHAYAALFALSAARAAGGRFLLRIEDIDAARCRPEFAAALVEDLHWLGVQWDGPVRRQSEHFADYRAALGRLAHLGVLYPCFCTRADIAREIAGAGSAPQGPSRPGNGNDSSHGGPRYPGTCRVLPARERQLRLARGDGHALRLDVGKAMSLCGPLSFVDRGHGAGPGAGRIAVDPLSMGDVVLGRKEVPASYHLSVTVDDHIQGVTLVTRGQDLLPATHIHCLLQELLGLLRPEYHHHRLLTDEQGVRLAKRDRALTLRALRDAGHGPEEVRRLVGL